MSSLSKFMRGSPLLEAGNTAPGCHLSKQEKELFPIILKACNDWGLDFYPTIIQKCRYDEISEIAAYGGFPKRYLHWSFGMEYEDLQRRYALNMAKIFEMVINSCPSIIYILSSNTLVDNLTVVAHATGHNHFFKNNIYFQATFKDAVNKFANHATRIQRYIDRWGQDKVVQFIDHVLRIDTLIDPSYAWQERVVKEPVIKDKRVYEQSYRLTVDEKRPYLRPYINTDDFRREQDEKARRREAARELGLFQKPEKDVMRFLIEHAPLKPWQADIMSMLYEEALYYAPQRETKTINEGLASYTDYHIMAKQGYVSLGQKNDGDGIVQYARHKMEVLGGKYSMNPYKLGFNLLCDIEDRWDKGRFGPEYEACRDRNKKEDWDLKLGQGKEKVFEVCKYYNDALLISEFFTQEFCNKYEFFEWKKYPNGEYRIETRADTPEGFRKIKRNLIERYTNGGLPDIRLADANHRGRGWLLLEHQYTGRNLHEPYATSVLTSLYSIWGDNVLLVTADREGEELIYFCDGEDPEEDVEAVDRKNYERLV